MSTILGISNPNHNSGAALVDDGEILGAVGEAKLSRLKRDARFPVASINYLLDLIDSQEVDEIAISGDEGTTPRRLLRKGFARSRDTHEKVDTFFRYLYSILTDDHQSATASELEGYVRRERVKLPTGISTTYVDHHEAHAASAYFTSGFDETVVLTADGSGDGISSTVYVGEDGKLSRIATNDWIDSVGRLWSRLPTVFGFKGERHAGKFMGLAAYAGEPPAELRAEMEGMLQVDGLEIRNEFFREHEHLSDEEQILELKRQFGNYSATEVAATLQQRTEAVLTEFAQAAIDEIGVGNVAVAGGVFANVKVNQRLYELSDVDRFFVHPDMRDSGLAVGAALRRCAELGEVQPGRLTHVYYGPTFEDVEVKQTVDRAKRAGPLDVTRFEETTELADSVATLLADGEVVNLFTGRAEYGPRALGNRTILYQPNDPTAIEWLNQRLKRSEFMPFAPVTMREHASECYVGYDPEACPAADFMTISFDCTDQMLERATGVVHVDGTARPQIIERETNPLYYAILEAYHERTGIPSLINTSFNMHGEPIVCTPSQALKAFRDSRTDALVLEKWLVKRS